MAYMYIKNGHFYPFDNLGDNLADLGYNRSDGFDVDTLLAYPIALLNNKGFLTLQCCEGHPLNDVYYESAEEYTQRMLKDDSDRDRMFDIRKNMDGENYVCFEGYPNTGAFVIFEREIELPSIPEGWEYQEDNSIRWNCDSFLNPTDYYKKLICAIEVLTLWAEKL
jgi:hypothetical protein